MSEHLVPESVTLTELDVAVVNALQINPRASWADVGRVLEVDASTVARRWARLEEYGAAWVSCQPLFSGDPAMAYVEISVAPGTSLEVAKVLADDPQAMTIDLVAGARDLVVTVVCADAAQLSWYLLERMVRVPNVRAVQSQILVRSYADASGWTLRALTPRQEKQLRATLPAQVEGGRSEVTDDTDRALAVALSANGRASLSVLASAANTSESTVRRRLAALTLKRVVRLRCELARELTGWPVSEWFFARVPSDRIDAAAQSLSGIAEVRAVLSAAGPYNLLVAVWLRTVADGQRLETLIMKKLPHVDIADRSVVIRPYKLAGRLLDPRGFSVGAVPLDLDHRPS